MSSVLEYVRQKDPRFNDVPDDELSAYIARKDPRFLQDEEFRQEHMRLNPSPSLQPQTSKFGLDSEVPPVRSEPRMTIREAGQPPVSEELLKPTELIPELTLGLTPGVEASTAALVQSRSEEANQLHTLYLETDDLLRDKPKERALLREGYKQQMADLGVRVVDKSITSLPEAVHKPVLSIPRTTSEEAQKALDVGPAAGGIVSGAQNAAADLTEFFLTPLGISTLGMGMLPRAAQRVVSAGFAAQMASSMPEQAGTLWEAVKARDAQATTRSLLNLGFTPAFIAGAGRHALGIPGLRMGEANPNAPTRMLAEQLDRAAKAFNLPKDVTDRAAMDRWANENPQIVQWQEAFDKAQTIATDFSLPDETRQRGAEVAQKLDEQLAEYTKESAPTEARVTPEPVTATPPESLPPEGPPSVGAVTAAVPESKAVTPTPPAVTEPISTSTGTSQARNPAEMSPAEYMAEATATVPGTAKTTRAVPDWKLGHNVIQEGTRAKSAEEAHAIQIKLALRAGDQVNAEAVEKYGIKLPADYEKVGELQVKKGAPNAIETQRTESAGTISTVEAVRNIKQELGEDVTRRAFDRYEVARYGKLPKDKPGHKGTKFALFAKEYYRGNEIAKREVQNAIQEREAAPIPVAEAPEAGKEVGAQVREQAPEAPKAEVEPPSEPPKPPIGDAATAELADAGLTQTSIRNSQIEKENERMGLPPVVGPLRRSQPAAFDMAMAKQDADPGLADRLATELKDNPRAMDDWEVMLMHWKRADMMNEYAKLTREVAKAYDAGRFEDVERLKPQVSNLANQVAEFGNVTRLAGSEAGRGLAARAAFVTDKLELSNMLAERRAAKGGAPLTGPEIKELEEMYAKSEANRELAEKALVVQEARASRAEFELVLKEQLLEEARQPKYSPQIIQMAEKWVAKLDGMASESEKWLAKNLGNLSAGIDPTMLYHLARVGAAKIGHGVLDVAKWGAKMVDQFGERVKPFLDEIHAAAMKFHDEQVGEMAKTVGTKKAKQAADAASRRTEAEEMAILEERLGQKIQAGKLDSVQPIIQKMLRIYASRGIKELEQVLDELHPMLQQYLPEITRREAMDAASGYGKFKPLPKDTISAQVRDWKGQAQQLAKLEDIQARKPLQKTGVERREPSDKERRLISQVNEAKRQFGVVVTDPATQLKSALDARKTYYTHRLADLQEQIKAREKFVKTRSPSPTDPELEALRAEVKTAKEEFDSIFTPPELTDAQRIERAIAAQERSIERNKQRIKEGKFTTEKAKKLSSERLDALRAENEALRDDIQYGKDLMNPKPFGVDLSNKNLKARITRSVADYKRRIAEGDFSPRRRPARDISEYEDVMRFKAQERKVREDYEAVLTKHKYDSASAGRKVYQNLIDGINLSRQILTSWDISAPGRQGLFLSVGHPKLAAKAFVTMLKSIRSDDTAMAINESILNRPNALNGNYQKAKLYLAPLERGKGATMEEAKMLGEVTPIGRLGKHIPGVGASQRAYVTYLNMIRADAFDLFQSSMAKKGKLSDVELKAVGNFINVATGRGSMANKASAAEFLATVFFAPRLVASRFQLLGGQPFYQGSARTRMLVADQYGRFLTGMAAFYGLSYLAGGEIERDPRSSDFGKVKFGNTRIDPLAGLAQVSTLTTRLTSALVNSVWNGVSGRNLTDGDIKKLDGSMQFLGEAKFGQRDFAGGIGTFLRTKLAPVPGTIVDIGGRKNVVGEPVTIGSAALNFVTPLAYKDIYSIMQEHGVPAATAIQMLSLLGVGVQQYEQSAPAGRSRSRSR